MSVSSATLKALCLELSAAVHALDEARTGTAEGEGGGLGDTLSQQGREAQKICDLEAHIAVEMYQLHYYGELVSAALTV